MIMIMINIMIYGVTYGTKVWLSLQRGCKCKILNAMRYESDILFWV